jgi:predicted NUDIX family phosphoesterase
MQNRILNNYNDSVQECIRIFGPAFSRIEQIDTSRKDQNEVGYLITKKSLEAVREVLEEKIAYFDLKNIAFNERDCIKFSKIRDSFPKLNYDSRKNVEASDSCVQPIAIGVIRSKNRKEVLTGIKLQKSIKARSPEASRTLCWFGGHVRSEDMKALRENKDDYIAVIKEAARREIKEELDLDVILKDNPEFCIWDQDNESGRRHIAFVFDIIVDFSTTKFHADAKEFSSDHIGLLEQRQFSESGNITVDSWSFLILREILRWKSAPAFEQTEFKFR